MVVGDLFVIVVVGWLFVLLKLVDWNLTLLIIFSSFLGIGRGLITFDEGLRLLLNNGDRV